MTDNNWLVTRRAFIVGAGAISLASCSTYIPEGATTLEQVTPATALLKINRVRRDHGRPELTYSASLARAAQNHVNLMASRGELSHTIGGNLRERVDAVGYHGAVGENLAGGQSTLEAAISGWLESPAHRQILLEPNYKEFGLAAKAGTGRLRTYWALIMGGDTADFIGRRR